MRSLGRAALKHRQAQRELARPFLFQRSFIYLCGRDEIGLHPDLLQQRKAARAGAGQHKTRPSDCLRCHLKRPTAVAAT
jgi:hypothetical protein